MWPTVQRPTTATAMMVMTMPMTKSVLTVKLRKPRAAGIFRNVYGVITITLSKDQDTRARYKTTNKLPLLRAV